MLAFCHSYKTAGTTFTTLLRRHFGMRHFDRPGFRHRILSARHLRRIRWVYPGLASIGGHPVRPYSDLADADANIRYYSFLRDPVDRSISHVTWYLRWKAHEGVLFKDFEAVLKEWASASENRNLQCRHLSPDGTAEGVKAVAAKVPLYILRVDQFDASLLLFRDWAGIRDMDIRYRSLNTSSDPYERLQQSHPDYLKSIREFRARLKTDPSLLQILEEANQEDQKLLEWAGSEVWPRQVNVYSGDLALDLKQFQQDNQQDVPSPGEPALARLYRNAVFKPLRPLLLPTGEPPEMENSPWV